MNPNPEPRTENKNAFTLIELLVVIAIIAALAAMIFAAMPAVNASRMKAVARAELTQISTAIEAYKARYNNYPPDNRLNPAKPPLYFELTGMLISGGSYKSLDGSYSVPVGTVNTSFNVDGLVNASTSAQGTDDQRPPENFLKTLKPDQLATNGSVRVLICSADDSVWNYRSTNPTNNPNSYDLWIDLVAGGRTNRIANWNK
ncbi:MAG TPA: prepilin-type N-terminal cleavage/methylation domain-containing protein [Candidatus Paceibacterota bacterium]|nr:prepilin-type N-terminal cleavage/methylation domain-containing protein [Candidatus Paceibacterota bacterium]